ncbi:protein-glutamate O-methyltransferase CheR [Pseudoroseicyclus sp. CXY001]|uniref:CheR family methyltransferase n=1 Tax=Pseudoroseicyclus sp. CXY001 TaxID=3242492 RepID=UPI003570EDD8
MLEAPDPGPPQRQGGQEFALTGADFAAIARLAYQHFGLHLTESKRSLVYSRLARRLRKKGLPDFAAYVVLLNGPEWEAEKLDFLTALTTNTTHFYREAHHFTRLEKEVLPPLIEAARKKRGRVRLWSAASSSGQEPYSMAMSVLRVCPEAASLDIKILATDIDPVIVNKAREAVYLPEEYQSMPADMRAECTQPVPGNYKLSPKVTGLVTFGILNLMDELPFRGPFDAIFCRNVAIYFDKPTQVKVFTKLTHVLRPGGELFIGHSERLSGEVSNYYENSGITSYKRRADAARPKPRSLNV